MRIHENDDATVTAAKLDDAIADLIPEEERRWVMSSLEPLVGLVPEDVALRDRTTELFTGWRIFLESLAERRPLVLVIDDLQWADEGLLDFVDGLVDLVESVRSSWSPVRGPSCSSDARTGAAASATP